MTSPICIRPQGDLTIQQAAAQRETLLAALQARADEPGGLTLDLSDVEGFDSAGLQLLLALHNSLRARNTELSIAGATQAVTDALAVYGLDCRLRSTLGGAA